jgi:hypothetical protein
MRLSENHANGHKSMNADAPIRPAELVIIRIGKRMHVP